MGMLLLQFAVFLLALVTTASTSLASDDGPFIGVDFGTYDSCIGVYRNGEVLMIPNEHGKIISPSWVRYNPATISVGDMAVEFAHKFAHLEPAVLGVKRYLGINVSEAPDVLTQWGSNKMDFDPEYVAGVILGNLRKSAERYLGSKITSAVISVPGVYGYAQRQALISAAIIGGFKSVNLINDPTAIALAYGTTKIEGKKVLVVDFGGSSVDVGIITVDNGNVHVLGGGGSLSLGGQNFNMRLMLLIYEQVKKEKNMNPFHDIQSVLKSWNACEAAKIVLSKVETTTIEIQLEDQFKVEYGISIQISRDQFELLIKDELRAVEDLILHAIEKVGLDKKDVDMVLMAGGSSQVPKVKQLLFSLFKGKKVVFLEKDKAVAYGAAMYGANLSGKLGTEGIQLYQTNQRSCRARVLESAFKLVFKEDDQIPAAKSILLRTSEESAPVADDGTANSVHYDLDVHELLSQRVITQAAADIPVKYGVLGVEDAVSQGVLAQEVVPDTERVVQIASSSPPPVNLFEEIYPNLTLGELVDACGEAAESNYGGIESQKELCEIVSESTSCFKQRKKFPSRCRS